MALRIAPPDLKLPWQSASKEDNRFGRILAWCLLPFLLLSLAVPFIDTPEPQREDLERLPPQLARVVLEEKELPEPPPPEPEEPEPEEPEPEEPEPEEPELEPQPEPEPQPVEVVQEAREKAQQSGVLQFSDDLAAMRESIDVEEVTSAEISRSEGEAAEVDRNIVANRASTRSGGVNTDDLSRDVAAAALSGRETTRVDNRMAASGAGNSQTREGAASEEAGRSDESIRKIMDRNKSAIFAIYNRALRRDPTLQGRVVVKMVIEPSGAVSSAEIVSSDLNNEDLESKILARIRLISFGAEDVGSTTLNYTFDFLPS